MPRKDSSNLSEFTFAGSTNDQRGEEGREQMFRIQQELSHLINMCDSKDEEFMSP